MYMESHAGTKYVTPLTVGDFLLLHFNKVPGILIGYE